MRYIYVAGPLGACPQGRRQHARRAIEAAAQLRDQGFFPFVPQLNVFWHEQSPRDYEDWLAYDFAWLRRCDALLRLPGYSPGADREVALAQELVLPVFWSLNELLAQVKNRC